MATLTTLQAATGFPVSSHGHGGTAKVAVGVYNFSSAPSAADIVNACKVPAGAVVYGGWLMADDLDTGTETLEIDVGFAANGVDSADPDAFLNSGVLTGDVVAGYKPVAGIIVPFQGILLTAGPKLFTAETTLTATITAAAAAGGTGFATLVANYFVDPNWSNT